MTITEFSTEQLRGELNRREEQEKNEINSKLHPLTIDFIDQIKEALSDFGEYTFGDKGAHEVMGISSIVSKLKPLPIDEVGTILTQCLDSTEVKEQFTEEFVNSVICDMNRRSDFDSLFELDDRFE